MRNSAQHRKALVMYIYRVVIDGHDTSPTLAGGARVVTYSRGYDRADALRRIGSIKIARDGTVSDGISPWPGTWNLPVGPVVPRAFLTWEVVSIRVVPRAGKARIL